MTTPTTHDNPASATSYGSRRLLGGEPMSATLFASVGQIVEAPPQLCHHQGIRSRKKFLRTTNPLPSLLAPFHLFHLPGLLHWAQTWDLHPLADSRAQNTMQIHQIQNLRNLRARTVGSLNIPMSRHCLLLLHHLLPRHRHLLPQNHPYHLLTLLLRHICPLGEPQNLGPGSRNIPMLRHLHPPSLCHCPRCLMQTSPRTLPHPWRPMWQRTIRPSSLVL